MAISKKRVPPVKDAEIAKAISKIYDDLNEVINAVNEGDSTEAKETKEGKSGDIRVVKDGEGKYFLEAKADEGWLRTIPGVMQFRNKLETTIDAVTALEMDEVDFSNLQTNRLHVVSSSANSDNDISEVKFWCGRNLAPTDSDDREQGFGVGVGDGGTILYFSQDEDEGDNAHYANFRLKSPTTSTEKKFRFYIDNASGNQVLAGWIDADGWHDG